MGNNGTTLLVQLQHNNRAWPCISYLLVATIQAAADDEACLGVNHTVNGKVLPLTNVLSK